MNAALERATIVRDGNLIEPEDLGLSKGAPTSCRPASLVCGNLTVVEHETMARVLQETHWNKSHAAMRLGLSRTQLHTRMREHGLGGGNGPQLSWPFFAQSAHNRYQSLMDFGWGEAHSPATRVKGGSQRG